MSQKSIIAATIIAGIAFATTPAKADDWGCEVLLCTMSNNPAWPGVPSCIAPMTRLMSAMNGWFFRWPICEGAGATRPRRSSYPDCPLGQDSIALSDLSPGCINRSNQMIVGRDQRAEPWYLDMKNTDGTATRHWFSLTR